MPSKKSQNPRQNASSQKPDHSAKSLIFARFKAFITDMFMIYTPLLYIMTYVILGSAQNFRENQSAIFLCIFLYGFISSVFFSAKGQTPGYRYVNLILSRQDGSRVSFLLAFVRFFVWLLSMALVIGLFFPFFHREKCALHDVICRTKVKFGVKNPPTLK